MTYYVNKEFFETSEENIAQVKELNTLLPPSRKEPKLRAGFYTNKDIYPLALSRDGLVYSVYTGNNISPIKLHVSKRRYPVFHIKVNLRGRRLSVSYYQTYAAIFCPPPKGMERSYSPRVFARSGVRLYELGNRISDPSLLMWSEEMDSEKRALWYNRSTPNKNHKKVYFLDIQTNLVHVLNGFVGSVEFLSKQLEGFEINKFSIATMKAKGALYKKRFYVLQDEVGECIVKAGEINPLPDYMDEAKICVLNCTAASLEGFDTEEDLFDRFPELETLDNNKELRKKGMLRNRKAGIAHRGAWVSEGYFMLGGKFSNDNGPIKLA